MKKIIKKTQQKIYAIWLKAKQHISSFVGGQFKKRQKRNEGDYKHIISKYFNNNIEMFMEEKEQYKTNINRLFELVKSMKERIITYSELNEYKKILLDLSILDEKKFQEIISNYGYNNIDDIYESINKYKNDTNINRTKIDNLIGEFSGTTYQTHIKFVDNFEDFVKDIKKKRK